MRMGVVGGVFLLLYFIAINWPVMAWIERKSVPPEMIWIGPLPLQYFWVLIWSLGALVVLVLMALTVGRAIADRVEKFEHTLGRDEPGA